MTRHETATPARSVPAVEVGTMPQCLSFCLRPEFEPPSEQTLYDGQPRISEIRAYMHSIGLQFAGMERPGWMGPLKCEGTVKFHRQ